MKTGLNLLILTVLFSQVLAAPFQLSAQGSLVKKSVTRTADADPETPSCRIFKGPSRCVDEPLPIADKEPWCPYRMCAPSYVLADDCPVNRDVQATDKCREETITRDIYMCDGKEFGHTHVPVGCEKGAPGCEYLATCSCFKIEARTSTVLEQAEPYKPVCHP